jgi:hypothetical protein
MLSQSCHAGTVIDQKKGVELLPGVVAQSA